jgi:hydrogenase maturation factor
LNILSEDEAHETLAVLNEIDQINRELNVPDEK